MITSRDNLDSPGEQPGVCGSHLRGCYKYTEARGSWGQAFVFNFLKSTPLAITAAELRIFLFSFLLKSIISAASILTPLAEEKLYMKQYSFHMIQSGFLICVVEACAMAEQIVFSLLDILCVSLGCFVHLFVVFVLSRSIPSEGM